MPSDGLIKAICVATCSFYLTSTPVANAHPWISTPAREQLAGMFLCPMCLSATLGIKEHLFNRGRQGFASHPFGVPLTEFIPPEKND